jgi:hypothetical protein
MTPERLLPDTCAWIEFFRGKPTPMAQALEHELLQGEVATCGGATDSSRRIEASMCNLRRWTAFAISSHD